MSKDCLKPSQPRENVMAQTSKAMQQAQENRRLMQVAKTWQERAQEAEERAKDAEAKAEEVGRAIWDAILRAAQEAVQEDEQARTVERAMAKWQAGNRRLTAPETKALVREMQNRDLFRWAAATGRFPKPRSLPQQPRRLQNGRKPLKALPRPASQGPKKGSAEL